MSHLDCRRIPDLQKLTVRKARRRVSALHRSHRHSKAPFNDLPSIAITPPFASAATSVAVSRPNAASSAFGSSIRNTVENVSCEGMPCLSLRKRFRNLSFAQPNSAISEQYRAPHSTARNAINRISTKSCREFSALGSGTLSNAVRKSCIGDPLRISGSPLKNPQFALLQAPSNQVICDSPAHQWGPSSNGTELLGKVCAAND